MKPTRAGWVLSLLGALTLAAAASSGNNLLYLVYSAVLAVMLVSWILGRLNTAGIAVEPSVPDQVFQGADFPLSLRLTRRAGLASHFLALRWGDREAFVERLSAEQPATATLRTTVPGRGIQRLEGLALESSFPFGLLLHRRKLPPVPVLALPRLREIRSSQELTSVAQPGGFLSLRKGSGDEFFGVREYTESDDTRWINWKLSAKQGRPLITEFAEPAGSKILVRLDSLEPGRIEEAASACRFFIDGGAEVKLLTPESEEPFGKGLLHLERLLRCLALLGEGKTPRGVPSPAGKEPDIRLDSVFLRRWTWAAGAMILGSMLLIDGISTALIASVALVLPPSLWLQEKDGPWLPKPAWDAFSLAVLAYVTIADLNLSGIIATNTHLVLYLLANRLLNPLRGDSFGQTFLILFLAFFLVSGQTISLWYFPAFILFSLLAAARLAGSAGARAAAWRSWAAPVLAAWLAALVLAGVSFAATPRFETWYQRNPLVSALGLDKLRASAGSVSGFTENVSLGFYGQLHRSAARVMRIKPTPPPVGTPQPIYVRGSAFDFFDGRRWQKTPTDFRYRIDRWLYPSLRGRAWIARRGFRLELSAPASIVPSLNLEFTVYPLNSAVLFFVGRPLSFDGLDQTVGFDASDTLYFDAPRVAGARYRVLAAADSSGFGNLIDGYPRLVRSRFLQTPDSTSHRLRELARSLTAKLPDDGAKVHAIEAYLRSNYRYSLFSEDANTSLDDFLFRVKSGNCEYFATAQAILLRLAGVPSRLAAGFLAQGWNEYGLFYDVRQSEAHAWVEAYVDGRWILSDPTPPAESSMRDDVLDKLSRLFNAAQARWYQNVIGYDTYVQRNTFYRLGAGTMRESLEKFVKLALYGGLLAGLGVSIWSLGVWAFRRARSPRGPYLRAQEALERAGLKREIHQTPREFARAVSLARPGLDALGELAEWHYLEKYGGRTPSKDERDRAERLLQEVLSRL